MSNIKKTAEMNLDALVDALDGMDPSDLAGHLNNIVEAAQKMTAIESADNEIELSEAEDRAGFELVSAKKISCDTLFCYYISGEATGHAYSLGWNGADGWTQCDARHASEVSLDELADDSDALKYCDFSELNDGELSIYIRDENKETDRAISIAVDRVWAGSGVLRAGKIADCAAVLGDSQEESDRIYEAIESAIEDGDDSLDDEGKTYTWTLDEEPESHTHEESETQTFAISSIDDVPIEEVADRLDEARRAGLGIDGDLLTKIEKLSAE